MNTRFAHLSTLLLLTSLAGTAAAQNNAPRIGVGTAERVPIASTPVVSRSPVTQF